MATIRAYELARQLGIDTRYVLQICKDLGEFVRSASSPIQPPVERRVREHAATLSPNQLAAMKRPPEPVKRPAYAPARRTGVVPAPRRTSEQEKWWEPRLPPTAWTPPLKSDRLDELLRADARGELPRSTRRRDGDRRRVRREEPKPPPDIWAQNFFEPSEREAWEAVGIYAPHLAMNCIEKGLGPDQMLERVEGRTITERLQGGEKLSVILAIRREEQQRKASGQ